LPQVGEYFQMEWTLFSLQLRQLLDVKRLGTAAEGDAKDKKQGEDVLHYGIGKEFDFNLLER